MKPKLILYLALVLSGGLFTHNCHAAIIFPKLPQGCPQMTSKVLADLRKVHPDLFPTNLPLEKLIASKPFRCYFVKYQSILSGKLPESESSYADSRRLPEKMAKEICHDYVSYMVLNGTNILEILTVGLDAENHWKTFGTFVLQGQPNPMWIAYRKAKMLPQVKDYDYEFRFLMVGLEIQTVWLHGKTDDILIPFPHEYPTPWKGYQSYSVGEMGEFLRKELDQTTNNVGGILNSNDMKQAVK
jgi:hypothetical protein